MDIYFKKSQWKLYLAVAGVVIILISLLYTTYLSNRLAIEEQNKARHWAMAQTEVNSPEPPKNLS